MGLTAIQKDSSKINFAHYSLLIHMMLFYGQELDLWPDEIRIRCNDDNQPLSIQLWTLIWDCRFVRSSYIHFEEYFVKTLYKFYDQAYNFALSEDVKRFLRPVDLRGLETVKHNWGDWYYFFYITMIRIYGFEGSSLLFPNTVLDRIAYLEIIRQMGDSDHMHLGSHDKQSFFPETLCCRIHC